VPDAEGTVYVSICQFYPNRMSTREHFPRYADVLETFVGHGEFRKGLSEANLVRVVAYGGGPQLEINGEHGEHWDKHPFAFSHKDTSELWEALVARGILPQELGPGEVARRWLCPCWDRHLWESKRCQRCDGGAMHSPPVTGFFLWASMGAENILRREALAREAAHDAARRTQQEPPSCIGWYNQPTLGVPVAQGGYRNAESVASYPAAKALRALHSPVLGILSEVIQLRVPTPTDTWNTDPDTEKSSWLRL